MPSRGVSGDCPPCRVRPGFSGWSRAWGIPEVHVLRSGVCVSFCLVESFAPGLENLSGIGEKGRKKGFCVNRTRRIRGEPCNASPRG